MKQFVGKSFPQRDWLGSANSSNPAQDLVLTDQGASSSALFMNTSSAEHFDASCQEMERDGKSYKS